MSYACIELRSMADEYWQEGWTRISAARIADYIRMMIEKESSNKPEVIELVCKLDEHEWVEIKRYILNDTTDVRNTVPTGRSRSYIEMAHNLETARSFS